MALLIIFLILDGLASLVVALAVYTNRVSIMDLQQLQVRRLSNLDASIAYFGKRLAKLKDARYKCTLERAGLDDADPRQIEFEHRYEVYTVQIVLLEDIISYLKLC